MNDMYTEAGVKKQKSAKDALIKVAIFVADAILLFAGLLGASILLFLGIAATVATFYFLPPSLHHPGDALQEVHPRMRGYALQLG